MPDAKHILIAPYTFKGTFTATELASIIASEAQSLLPDADCRILPLGDGGSDTLDALVAGLGGIVYTSACPSATGEVRTARWAMLNDGRAVIVGAECIPLAEVPREQRNPATLTTRGIGELIRCALDEGCRDLVIGLGDTATHDCGIGLASMLGIRFLDAADVMLEPVGRSLSLLQRIDRSGVDPRMLEATITVLCDVMNPLLGSDGAALRFAAQKGADIDTVHQLEEGSRQFCSVVERDGVMIADVPGAGAAGGLGGGLAALFGARLDSGAEAVLDAVRFDQLLEQCNIVITAEGRVDHKTLLGKGVMHVASRARNAGVRCVVLTGSVEGNHGEIERQLGATIVAAREDATAPSDRAEAEIELRRSVIESIEKST